MNREYLKKSKYDWIKDPNGYRIQHKAGSYPDPKRCTYCGKFFMKENEGVAYCGFCSKAMSMGGENFLGNYSPVVENARITIPDEYIERINWQLFNLKFVLDFINEEFARRRKQVTTDTAIILSELKDVEITFEDIKHKVPMLISSNAPRNKEVYDPPSRESYEARFTRANEFN